MVRNLDQLLTEMPVSRLDVVVARAHSLASTQSAMGMKCPSCTSILVSDATDAQRPWEVEKTGAPLPSGNLCLSCGEVVLDVRGRHLPPFAEVPKGFTSQKIPKTV